jgi:hypothetical protein
VTAVAPHFLPVQRRGYDFAKENAGAYFEMLDEVTSAANMHDGLIIQCHYAQVQAQVYVHQARELGGLMAIASKNSGQLLFFRQYEGKASHNTELKCDTC